MYSWLVALHLVGLVVFVAAHGASMAVAFGVRAQRDRAVIAALLALSLGATRIAYLGLAGLGIGGLGAAATANLLAAPWIVASYVVVIGVLVAMYAIASPYYMGLRKALEGTADERPLDDAALASRLRTRRPELLAAIGGAGLATLLLLMTLRPALW